MSGGKIIEVAEIQGKAVIPLLKEELASEWLAEIQT